WLVTTGVRSGRAEPSSALDFPYILTLSWFKAADTDCRMCRGNPFGPVGRLETLSPARSSGPPTLSNGPDFETDNPMLAPLRVVRWNAFSRLPGRIRQWLGRYSASFSSLQHPCLVIVFGTAQPLGISHSSLPM